MRTEPIELVTQYKDGREVKEYAQKIFAKRKSLTRNEFYSAYGVGLRPQMIFAVNPAEYKLANVDFNGRTYKATHIRYNKELFEIVRTYEVDRFSMEITVK